MNHKITISEWANEYGVILTDEQIENLDDAIQIDYEMGLYQTGWTPGHPKQSEESKEIERLKSKLHQLECFVEEKGYSVTVTERYVEHYYMASISDSHSASQRDRYKY